MFKPKKKTEVVEEVKEVVAAVEEKEIENEDESEEEESEEPEEEEIIEPEEEESEEPEEDKASAQQKVNLTHGEVISGIEFNLQRASQLFQLLK